MKRYLLIILLSFLAVASAQTQTALKPIDSEQNWFIALNAGLQMSGIKDEDFVSTNYTPLFNITAGKWLLPYFALQIGYKGFYFYSISDDLKHHYHYLYGEGVLNFNKAVHPERTNQNWSLLLHSGVGYFYNNLYNKPNTCVNVGLQINYQLTNQFQATLDVSSIIGWDIYQGDTDILPGITLGVTYSF